MIKTTIETELEYNEAVIDGIEFSTFSLDDNIVTITIGSSSVDVDKSTVIKLVEGLYESFGVGSYTFGETNEDGGKED